MAREREFFSAIRLPNGSFKTTSSHRLDDFNEVILSTLPSDRRLLVKDVAVSSGVTTLEWAEQLRGAGIAHAMTATDLSLDAVLVSLPGEVRVLLDPREFVLQVDLAGYAIRPDQLVRRDKALYTLPVALATHVARWKLAQRRRGKPGNARARSINCQRLKLVTPRLLHEPGIELLEEDLLRPRECAKRWDVIRAANVLNPAYFDEGELRRILGGLSASLAQRGLLGICRTDTDGSDHGSVMRLVPGAGLR